MIPSPAVCEVVIPFSDVSLSDDECEVIFSYGSLSDGVWGGKSFSDVSLSDDECEVIVSYGPLSDKCVRW